MAVYGFMHAALLGSGEQIHLEQLETIRRTGLYDASEKISIGMLGRNHRAFADHGKFEIAYRSRQVEEHEFPTLRMLHEAASRMQPDDHVWYIHTKGANSYRPNSQPGPLGWRRFMEYYVLQHWRFLRGALWGHDCAGVQLRPEPWPHFSGNFWWARASYLRTLPVPMLTRSRTEAEEWLGLMGPRFYTALRWCIPDLYAVMPDPGLYSFYEPIRDRLTAGGDAEEASVESRAYLAMFLNSREAGWPRVLEIGLSDNGGVAAALSDAMELGALYGVLTHGAAGPALQERLGRSCFSDVRLAGCRDDVPTAPFLAGWTDPFDLAIIAHPAPPDVLVRTAAAAAVRLRQGGLLAVSIRQDDDATAAALCGISAMTPLWRLPSPFGWAVLSKSA